MPNSGRYRVELHRYDERDGAAPEKVWGPFSSEREAERVDGGINVNLNHAEYFTLVMPEPTHD